MAEKLTRREFMQLPMNERQKILRKQANNPEVQAYYEFLMSKPTPDLPEEQVIEELPDKWNEDIYNSLKEIQTEEKVELRDKAFIADFLSHKLRSLGYCSPSELSAIERAAMERERALLLGKDRPRIICLCGSTRFTDIMLVKQWELTKEGNVVLSWCALPDWYFTGDETAHIGDQEGVKEIVDEVHKRKIDLCDEVFVINKDGYIGESTKSEIDYAVAHNKPVKYMESELLGKGDEDG